MNEKSTLTDSLLPLIVRIQQLDSFRAHEVENYSLPPSNLKFEDVTRASFNFPSSETLPLFQSLQESLLSIYERMQAIQQKFEADGMLRDTLGNNAYESAVQVEDEAYGLIVELESLIKLHQNTVSPGTNQDDEDISPLPPSRLPKQQLDFDLNQSALFFSYLLESKVILGFTPNALAKLIAPLIGFSRNTLRTALSPGELDKTKKGGRNHYDQDKDYDLNIVRKKFENIIELIDRDLKTHHNS